MHLTGGHVSYDSESTLSDIEWMNIQLRCAERAKNASVEEVNRKLSNERPATMLAWCDNEVFHIVSYELWNEIHAISVKKGWDLDRVKVYAIEMLLNMTGVRTTSQMGTLIASVKIDAMTRIIREITDRIGHA